VFLELAKFASLLLAILSLDAVIHTAFLEPGSNLEHQLVPALRMLLLAAAVSLGSGCIFRVWQQREGGHRISVARSLPMLIFWWAGGVITLLFAVSWIVERYVLHLWS
jgi:hypothetical protein